MLAASRVTYDSKYSFDGTSLYLNGTQALVRLTIMERHRRKLAGRHTAVFISGYRGSPLGSFDQALAAAGEHLGPDTVFKPGVNEDTAATAIWGTQQLGTFGGGRYEGVSALWYGKGPGVDRSGDVFKHANLAGSAQQGGVLVVAGDDHACKSSTLAHQSEFALLDASIPVLVPASLSEILEYGLIGWELSRFSGLWAGLKVVTEIMDSAQSLLTDPLVNLVDHADFAFPPGGLSLRWPDLPLAQEERLHQYKIPAALAFARANQLDRVVLDARRAKLGLVTVGKAHADTMQALADLGITPARVQELGIRLYKVAMPWPLEPKGLRDFAEGLEEILVIEEKRSLIEDQIRKHLYGARSAPSVVGKHDERGAWLLPATAELGAGLIASRVAQWVARLTGDEVVAARGREIDKRLEAVASMQRLIERPPHFCPGCPHNTSTKLPESSKAFAGIGCHYLVLPMERETAGFTHMGGEGANWIGLAPFSTTSHMFQNIGDGTFFHSGSMAIRAAISAGVNITYKILFNHAVAMTGGQAVEGQLTVQQVVAIVVAEGAKRVMVVSDDPTRYPPDSFPAAVSVSPRDQLDAVQRKLREVAGVTVLVYDQICATELRRMRKRGKAEDPNVAVLINDLVCEGCGDCSVKSNCLAVVPVDTEFGRKRSVDLSTCNKDMSCIAGFCPSFVTVEGGKRRKVAILQAGGDELPPPAVQQAATSFSLVVAGIGGTGIVTIGALIGMAAHLEGKAVRVMDMTGLAQKGGAVVSHIQWAEAPARIEASRVSFGEADLLLGCDIVVAAAPDNLGRVSPTKGMIIANDHETITGLFARDPEYGVPLGPLRRQLAGAVSPGRAQFCDATGLATKLVGDAVGANLLLMGYAWQQGLIPLSLDALTTAIELNGAAVALNKEAFTWGRKAAIDLQAVERAAAGEQKEHHRLSGSLDELVARRVDFLVAYQDKAYGERYLNVVNEAKDVEQAFSSGDAKLAEAVARTLFKLMAYKDEYEVARLFTASGFLDHVKEKFEGPLKLHFHLAPPLMAKRDPATGHLRKQRFGPWMLKAFTLLAKAKRLRGTSLDVFGYTAERRAERKVIEDYIAMLRGELLPRITASNYSDAVTIAEAAIAIKGFGHIKQRNMQQALQRQKTLLETFCKSPATAQPKESLETTI